MTFIMDEKLKHRLIGLAVVISLAAIFIPALMRKPNKTLDMISLHVAVPPKPTAPKIVLTKEKDLFKTSKVAKVILPQVPMEKQLPQIVIAESLRSTENKEAMHLSQSEIDKKIQAKTIAYTPNQHKQKLETHLAKSLDAVLAKNKTKPILRPKISKSVIKASEKNPKNTYTVQLASFSKLANAQLLVAKLRAKGYKANLNKISTGHSSIYKISVGSSPNKNQALKLKNQLASAIQLDGFVVHSKVS